MMSGALALLLLAALLHCVWNLLLQRSIERFPFLLLTLIAASLPSLPLLTGLSLDAVPWPLVTAGALLEAAYFLLLASAYDRGEFSLIYPIARGAGFPGALECAGSAGAVLDRRS